MFQRDAAQVLEESKEKKLPLVGVYNIKTGEVYLHPGFEDYIYVIVDKDKNFVEGHRYVEKHNWDKTVPIEPGELKKYQAQGYAPRHFRYETDKTGPLLSSHLFILDGFIQPGESKDDYRGFAISKTDPLTFAWTSSSLNVRSENTAGYLPPPNKEKEPLPEYKDNIRKKVESLLFKEKKIEARQEEVKEAKLKVDDIDKDEKKLPTKETLKQKTKKEFKKSIQLHLFGYKRRKDKEKEAKNKIEGGYESEYTDESGTYQKGKELGKGAYGKVEEFINTKTSEKTVVKTIEMQPQDNPVDFRSAIEKEVRLTNKVYQNCRVIFFEDDTIAKVAQPLLPGRTLGNYLETNTDLKDILPVLINVLFALEVVHDKNIVHGDFSERNVIVDPDNDIAYMCDFGVAREVGEPTWKISYPRFAPEIDQPGMVAKTNQDLWQVGHILEKIDRDLEKENKGAPQLSQIGRLLKGSNPNARISLAKARELLKNELDQILIKEAILTNDPVNFITVLDSVEDKEATIKETLVNFAKEEKYTVLANFIKNFKKYSIVGEDEKQFNVSYERILLEQFVKYVDDGDSKKMEDMLLVPTSNEFLDNVVQFIYAKESAFYFVKHQDFLKKYFTPKQLEKIELIIKEDKNINNEIANQIKKSYEKRRMPKIKEMLKLLNKDSFNKITNPNLRLLCETFYLANEKNIEFKLDEESYYKLVFDYKPEVIFTDKNLREKMIIYDIIDQAWLTKNADKLKQVESEEAEDRIIKEISAKFSGLSHESAIADIKNLESEKKLTPALREKFLNELNKPQCLAFQYELSLNLNFPMYLDILAILDPSHSKSARSKLFQTLQASNSILDKNQTYERMDKLCAEYKDYSLLYLYLSKLDYTSSEFKPEQYRQILSLLDKLKIPLVYYEVEKRALKLKQKVNASANTLNVKNYLEEKSREIKPGDQLTPDAIRHLEFAITEIERFFKEEFKLFVRFFNKENYQSIFDTMINKMHYFAVLNDPKMVDFIFQEIKKIQIEGYRDFLEFTLKDHLKSFNIEFKGPDKDKKFEVKPPELEKAPSVESLLHDFAEEKEQTLTPDQILKKVSELEEKNHSSGFVSLKPVVGITRTKFNDHQDARGFEALCTVCGAISQKREKSLVMQHPEDKKISVIYLSAGDIEKLEKRTKVDLGTLLKTYQGKIDPFISYFLIVTSKAAAVEFMKKYEVQFSHSLSKGGTKAPKSIIELPSGVKGKEKYGIYLSSQDLDIIQKKVVAKEFDTKPNKSK